jgi:hypothetical protein
MKWLSSKNVRKWLRLIHRDLGYFVVGITLVYAISGIILNHKKPQHDPAYKTIRFDETVTKNMSISELQYYFTSEHSNHKLNRVLPNNNRYQLFISGGIGSYEPETGNLQFELYKKKPFVFFINKLHYNQKKYWTAPADFYAGALIFLALSGLFMVRGKNSLLQRGKWFVIAGFIAVLIYLWL